MQLPIELRVQANKKKTEITKIENNIYHINVKSRAENNKANIEIIKFFSKLSGKQVRILSGLKSKKKLIG